MKETDLAPAFLVSDLDLVLEVSDDLVASRTRPDEPPTIRGRDPFRGRDLHVYLMHRTAKYTSGHYVKFSQMSQGIH